MRHFLERSDDYTDRVEAISLVKGLALEAVISAWVNSLLMASALHPLLKDSGCIADRHGKDSWEFVGMELKQ